MITRPATPRRRPAVLLVHQAIRIRARRLKARHGQRLALQAGVRQPSLHKNSAVGFIAVFRADVARKEVVDVAQYHDLSRYTKVY